MSAPVPNVPVVAALSILSHVSFAPILGRLIRARVPDLLEGGAVQGAELAKQTGLHPLSTVRALRALTAFGVFREIAPSTFVNTDVSRLFRDAPGCIRNYALFATSDQYLNSFAALGRSLEHGRAAHDLALGQSVWDYMGRGAWSHLCRDRLGSARMPHHPWRSTGTTRYSGHRR